MIFRDRNNATVQPLSCNTFCPRPAANLLISQPHSNQMKTLLTLVFQNGWFIMENPIKSIKMDDLGVPLLLETPKYLLRFGVLIGMFLGSKSLFTRCLEALGLVYTEGDTIQFTDFYMPLSGTLLTNLHTRWAPSRSL